MNMPNVTISNKILMCGKLNQQCEMFCTKNSINDHRDRDTEHYKNAGLQLQCEVPNLRENTACV